MRPPSGRVLAALSLSAALVAGVGVAVLTSDRQGTSSLAPLHEPPALSSPVPVATASASESPTPEPAPSATPSRPASAAATSAAPRPAATQATTTPVTAPVGNFGPRPPGSVTVPYTPGQTYWDVTSHGIRLRVSMTKAKVGVPMTWTVKASSADAGCCAIKMLFGDGGGEPRNGMPCGTADPDVSFTHTYNGAGRREFMLQAGTAKHCGDSQHAVVYGTFDVAPGTPTAQGPSLPVVKFDRTVPVKGHEKDPSYVSLWGEAEDEDGHLTKLVATFGDGTSRTFEGDGMACQETRDGWPTPSFAQLPYQPPAYHHYPKPGTYTLTLTAYSAGCDGSQVQTAKASFTWTVPAKESATPSAEPTG